MELSLPLRLPPARPRRRGELRALPLNLLRARPRIARGALCLARALPPLGGGWLWLRGSSLVAIRHVRVVGVHGPQALAIRSALDRAAVGMTTMRFSAASLRAAVADYPIVSSVSARTSFPHGLSIRVTERQPVAVLVGPGQRSALAADGTVLGPALASASLPTVSSKAVPAPGAPVTEAAPLAAATVLGAAPTGLLRYVARVYEGPEGLTAQMRNGLLVYFGDATVPHAKWLSLARVLASADSNGALYVDVRLPSRPAAGFTLAAQAAPTAASASRIGAADPTAATLAERLAQATGSTSGAATAEESQSSSGSAQTSASATGREGPSAGGTAATAETTSREGAGQEGASREHPPAGAGSAEVETASAGGTQAPAEGSTSG
jgi:cell division protein FtsQ